MQPLRFLGLLLLILGFGVFIGLLSHQGAGQILAAVAQVGWGLLAIALWRALSLLAWSQSWRVLLPPAFHQPLPRVLWMRWISESVNALLPVAQVGGELVRARLLATRGVPGAVAGASVVGNLTGAILSKIAFVLLAVSLLVARGGGESQVLNAFLGVGLFGLLLAAFLWAQHAGMFVKLAQALEKLAGGRDWLSLVGGAALLDREVVAVYRRGLAFWRSTAWHLLGWLLQVGETWLGLYFLGHTLTLAEAILVEGLVQGIRSAAFIIPGGLGVQEGALILVGQLVGVPPHLALAQSLVKRVREVIVGLPALGVLHWVEARRIMHRRAESRRPVSRPTLEP